jgi:PAS domain S-box-containing protein
MNHNVVKHSKKDIQNFFSKAPYPMCITKFNDGTFIDVNKAYTNFSGFKPKDVIGRTSLEMNHITVEERAKVLNEINVKGYAANIEKETRDKNNEPRCIIFNTFPIKSGIDGLLMTSVTDITAFRLGKEAQNDILVQTLAAIRGTGVILIKDYNGKQSVFYENDEAKIILKGKSINDLLSALVEKESIYLSNETGYYNVKIVSTHNNLFTKIILLERLSRHKFTKEVIEQYLLTPRQKEIAFAVAFGYSNKEIAEKLCLSEYTIKDHVKEIFQKIDVHSRGKLFSKIFNL